MTPLLFERRQSEDLVTSFRISYILSISLFFVLKKNKKSFFIPYIMMLRLSFLHALYPFSPLSSADGQVSVYFLHMTGTIFT